MDPRRIRVTPLHFPQDRSRSLRLVGSRRPQSPHKRRVGLTPLRHGGCSNSALIAGDRWATSRDPAAAPRCTDCVRFLKRVAWPLPIEPMGGHMRRAILCAATATALALVAGSASAAAQGTDVRLSNDSGAGGYVSAYTLATGLPYTDGVLDECSMSRGRQNEPAVAVDPRNTSVILGSSNDYCGVFRPPGTATGSPAGPIWLGYYRSENGGQLFQSSLVPGYPGDTSPFAALADIRTASAGDPVIAWDNHGRAFFGSESSPTPAVRRRGSATSGSRHTKTPGAVTRRSMTASATSAPQRWRRAPRRR